MIKFKTIYNFFLIHVIAVALFCAIFFFFFLIEDVNHVID